MILFFSETVHFIHKDFGILTLPLEPDTTLKRPWLMFVSQDSPLDIRVTSRSVFRDIIDPPSDPLEATFELCGLTNDDIVEFVTDSPNDGRFLQSYYYKFEADYPSKRCANFVKYQPGMTVSRFISAIMKLENHHSNDEDKNVLFHFVKQDNREYLRPLFNPSCLPYMKATEVKDFENDSLWLWSNVVFVNAHYEKIDDTDVAWPWDRRVQQWTYGFCLTYKMDGQQETKYFMTLKNGDFWLIGSKNVVLSKDTNPCTVMSDSLPSPAKHPRTSTLAIFMLGDADSLPKDNVKVFRRCDCDSKMEGTYNRYSDFWVS